MSRRSLVVLILTSFVVAFGLFAHTIGGEFVGDDHTIVENREDLYNLKNIPSFFVAPAFPDKPSIRLYRPLTLSSYAFNFAFSKSSASFHVLNLTLHALSSILVFLIVSKFASRRAAWLTTIIFIFLPIHVESFVPVVGRSEILSAFFMLLSLLTFIERKYLFSSISFLFALFSKDFAVLLIPLFGALLMLDITENYRFHIKQAFKIGLYYLPSLAIYFLLRYLALGKYAFGSYIFNPITAPLAFISFKERFFTGFYGLSVYFKRTFYPVGLTPDYSYNQMPAVGNLFSSPGAIIGLLLLIFLVILIFVGKREVKISSLIVLVPFIFISNMFFITSGSFAERWWYFPSFGLVALVAIGLDETFKKLLWLKKPFYILGALALIWYSYLAVSYSRIWVDDQTFYVNTARRASNNAWARSNLAAVYLNDREFDKAWQEAKAALAIHDKYPPTLNVIGQLYWSEDNFKEAETAFKKALEYDIANRNARGLYRMLAFLSFDYGRNADAISYMNKVIELSPSVTEERVVRVDKVLYEFIKGYEKRDPHQYSKKEKEDIVSLIRLVRGF